MNEVPENIQVPFLSTDHFYCGRSENGLPELVRFIRRPGKVSDGLRDAPHASVSLSCSSKELHDHRTKTFTLQERPALIEHSDRFHFAASLRPLCRRIRNQQTHCRLKLRIVFQLLDVEVEPATVHVDRRLAVEKLGVHAVVYPRSELRCRLLCLVV